MGSVTGIAWTDHTFNGWWGCQRVSEGCEHCYAEEWDARWGGSHWGPTASRRLFGDKHWAEPLAWDRAATSAGRRDKVFCSSMADVFEDRRDLDPERWRLWKLIRSTGHLDWQLLTKRPQNLLRMLPWTIGAGNDNCWGDVCKASITDGVACPSDGCDIDERVRRFEPWPNVWVGTTVENQRRADERIRLLRAVPAVVRFLSMEPLLDLPQVDLTGIDWVIVGGESGKGARRFDLGWAQRLVDQCREQGVAVFVKQLGENATDGLVRIQTRSKKGTDPAEWPAPLQRREFPIPRTV